MTDFENNAQLARWSIQKFANEHRLHELTYLPINLVDENDPPAYTTNASINISRDVVMYEPQNAIVYVMHEIMHHVVHNAKETFSFNHRVVNIAEDFLINYLLYVYFGLDVRKVLFSGIYSEKAAKLGLRRACEEIVKKKNDKSFKNAKLCGCRFSANSVLNSVAKKLKTKFRFRIEDAMYYKDVEDLRTFERIRPDFANIVCSLPIDLNATLYSMFLKLYNREVVPTPNLGKVLTPSEAMANFMDATKLRKYTVGNEEVTSTVILSIFEQLKFMHEKTPLYVRKYKELQIDLKAEISAWEKRLATNTYKHYFKKDKSRYTKNEAKKLLRKLRRKLKTCESQLAKWKYREKNPLGKLLYKYPFKVKKPKSLYQTSTLNNLRPKKERFNEIEVVPNVATRELRSYLGRGVKRALMAIECYASLEEIFKDVLVEEKDFEPPEINEVDLDNLEKQQPAPEKSKNKEELLDKIMDEIKKASEKNNANQPKKDQENSTDDQPSEEEDEEGTTEGNEGSDVEDDGEGGKDDGESEEEEGDGTEEEEGGKNSSGEGGDSSGTGDGQPSPKNPNRDNFEDTNSLLDRDNGPRNGGGQGQGHGDGRSAAQLLSEIPIASLRSLTRILKYAEMFETRLVENRNRKIDDNESLALLPDVGNNLETVDPVELSLLHDPITQMLFYVKLSQHSLSIRSPRQNKLDAIVVAIDNSGSMQGKCYEVATGFSLALMKKLATTNREGALLSFSSRINGFVRIKRNSFNLTDILRVLLAPEWGGTAFEPPTYQAFHMKNEYKWKSLTYMLVTDGGGGFSEYCKEFVKRNKTKKDKLYGICTLHSGHALTELMDETIRLSASGSILSLTDLGNRVL